MGFGVAFFGYAFLLMHELGGALGAGLLLGYGFFLASKLNPKFMYASVTALFLIPRGVVLLLNVLGIIELDSLPALNIATFVVYIASWLTMSVFWMRAVLDIALANNALKLARQARRQLIVTVCFLIFSLAVQIVAFANVSIPFAGQIITIRYILQYALILYNLFFIHTCFVLITSEKQYTRDIQQLASERASELERRHNDKSGKGGQK